MDSALIGHSLASYVMYSVGSDCYDGGGVNWDGGRFKNPQDIPQVVVH